MFTQRVSIPVDELIWRNWQKIAKTANFVKLAKSPVFTQRVSIPVDELIWRNWQKIAKVANFVKIVKIANVHPRGFNTSGWTYLTKLAKDRQNCQFCQNRQNRQCSLNCCQYQWMTSLIWRNWQKIAKIANFANIVNCAALSPNLPFLSSRAFLDISAKGHL